MAPMNLPNALSLGRILASPVIYLLFLLPGVLGTGHGIIWLVLLVLWLGAEITDVVDGHLARKLSLVSPMGKVLDPLSDVVLHSTVLYYLAETGIIPGFLFALFLWRELGILVIRMILLTEGTAMAAGSGGKIKSFLFALACGAGLLTLGSQWKVLPAIEAPAALVTTILTSLGLLMSWISFIQYFRSFMNRKVPA